MKKAVIRIGRRDAAWPGVTWAWIVDRYNEDDTLEDSRMFDYYTGVGSQAAVDWAKEWDHNFCVQLGDKNA